MPSEIDTAAKRARLPARRNPYFQAIGGGRGGVSLGYRKGARSGVWVAKLVADKQRFEERIGTADDADAPAPSLGYRAAVSAALDWSRQQHATAEASRLAAVDKALTVASAVEAYSEIRLARAERAGRNAEGRLARYVLADAKFAATKLSRLRESTIETWRSTLPARLSPSTVNRLLSDLRAALNAALDRNRRALPAHLAGEISAGTRTIRAATVARKQILADQDVRAIVDAAFAVDQDGDFGRLILLAAATGARFSQLTAMRVRDVQPDASRVMIPSSRKGRAARAQPPVAIPVSPDVIARLAPALGRAPSDVLLLRWAYTRAVEAEPGRTRQGRWEKSARRPWGPAYEIDKPWAATIERAGVPADTVMYALRHSSIVRGLRANLPIRLVAALHNTSVEMIEAHYSAFIVDATEDLARRAVMSMAAPLQAAE